MRGRRAFVQLAGPTLAAGVFAAVAGCAGYSPPAPVSSVSSEPRTGRVHVVKRGETLYSIAWRYGLDYQQVAAWNGIRSPYTIYPGQRIGLYRGAQGSAYSSAGDKARPAAGPPKSVSSSSQEGKKATKSTKSDYLAKQTTKGPAKKADKTHGSVNGARNPRWHWPAKGRVITTFSKSGKKGIDISGRLGQPVYAASDGRVVYQGSGLIGYGKLIIVKHNKRYLSAYAHNNNVLVQEGDFVKGGQPIAEMGRTGAKRVMLHFEIRRDGKPIDPIRYLPK